jgi:hypothetical protein
MYYIYLMNGLPVRNDINNGTLAFVKSMPQKDLTSDNGSTNMMGRRTYEEISNGGHTVAIDKQKKFIGGNRDASSVVAKRRANSFKGFQNATANSNTTVRDINDTTSALRRVRAGGYVPPLKCAHLPTSVDITKYIF